MNDISNPKVLAKSLSKVLPPMIGKPLPYQEALELIATLAGTKNWQTFSAGLAVAEHQNVNEQKPIVSSTIASDSLTANKPTVKANKPTDEQMLAIQIEVANVRGLNWDNNSRKVLNDDGEGNYGKFSICTKDNRYQLDIEINLPSDAKTDCDVYFDLSCGPAHEFPKASIIGCHQVEECEDDYKGEWLATAFHGDPNFLSFLEDVIANKISFKQSVIAKNQGQVAVQSSLEPSEVVEVVGGLHRALSRMITKHDPDSIEAEWLTHSNELIRKLTGKDVTVHQ